MQKFTVTISQKHPIRGDVSVLIGSFLAEDNVLPNLRFEVNSVLRRRYERDIYFVPNDDADYNTLFTEPSLWKITDGAGVSHDFNGYIIEWDKKEQQFQDFKENIRLTVQLTQTTN